MRETIDRRCAAGLAVLLLVLLGLLAWRACDGVVAQLIAMSGAVAVAVLSYRWLMRKHRRRAVLRRQPFPSDWEAILNREVAFYRVLAESEKARFREAVVIFLAEKRVTGIRCEIDDTIRVLTAASAVIPVFGFPEWEWDQIGEILIYPNAFDDDYQSGAHSDAIGMVGSGAMNRTMILSKPHLVEGFRDPKDKHNVGVHEFVHLVDKVDGSVDGIPEIALGREAIGPWIEMIHGKTAAMNRGDGNDIPDYAMTNPAEFFAVTAEYFFERPHLLKQRHPRLYDALERIFRQDMRYRFRDAVKGLWRPYPKKIGRNAPCPCGSGRKYKKCCLQ